MSEYSSALAAFTAASEISLPLVWVPSDKHGPADTDSTSIAVKTDDFVIEALRVLNRPGPAKRPDPADLRRLGC